MLMKTADGEEITRLPALEMLREKACAALTEKEGHSRIERGKRHVRSGAIVDLHIEHSKVFARVQGTRMDLHRCFGFL